MFFNFDRTKVRYCARPSKTLSKSGLLKSSSDTSWSRNRVPTRLRSIAASRCAITKCCSLDSFDDVGRLVCNLRLFWILEYSSNVEVCLQKSSVADRGLVWWVLVASLIINSDLVGTYPSQFRFISLLKVTNSRIKISVLIFRRVGNPNPNFGQLEQILESSKFLLFFLQFYVKEILK